MSSEKSNDWNPETYARFRGLRLRPALDLLMQIGTPCGGPVVDLGCGDGAVSASLRTRFPKREIVGIDSSAAMLAKARGYDRVIEADIASWTPDAPPAVIYSNAALHWLPDHDAKSDAKAFSASSSMPNSAAKLVCWTTGTSPRKELT